MTKGTFKGGVHPYEGKELSMDKPTVKLLPGKELVYPMSQHIGAPSKPIVAVGDHVLMGQKIAEAGGFVSVPISASVSGTVKEIKPTLTVSGSIVDAIYKEAGIVGMGGAGFPTHIKLTPKDENAIDYIIVNGSECEPYLTSDYRMMLEEGEKLVDGVRIILQLFDNAQGVIAIEDNKPKAIEHISELVKDETRIRVQVVRTKYPEGSERQLIKAVTGRKINSSMLPADAGCIVNNVDTVISIHMAVAETTPLMRRVVTVSGDAVVNPQNFNVKTGTKYSEVLEAAGGFKVKPEKLISGGTMMGLGLFDVNIPVTKTSSALLAFIKDPMLLVPEGPCIRCGRCVEACPENLIPQMMMEASERFDDASFEAISGMECMECGSCTFVCPAGRKLTQSLKQTRRSILDNRKKK